MPDPTALVDWYVAELRAGAGAAYTHVGVVRHPPKTVGAGENRHTPCLPLGQAVIFRIPATRGSNYAVDRDLFLDLYRAGLLADEMNVGPSTVAASSVSYSGCREHRVLTSARMFRGGWLKLVRYLWYRLPYNIRVLPVGPDVADRTGRESDPVNRYDYTGHGGAGR